MVESDSVGRRVMGAEKSKITAKNPAPDTRRTTTVTLVKKSPAIPGEARKAELSKAKLTSRLGPKVVDEESLAHILNIWKVFLGEFAQQQKFAIYSANP